MPREYIRRQDVEALMFAAFNFTTACFGWTSALQLRGFQWVLVYSHPFFDDVVFTTPRNDSVWEQA